MSLQAITIDTTDSMLLEPKLEIVEGYSIESGFLSPYFANEKENLVIGSCDGNKFT